MSRQRLPQSVDADRPLTQRQKQIVDHILTTGKSVQECADELGTQATNIYRDLRKPHVKKYLHERTLSHIGILAPIAAHTQQQLLTSDSDHVRASVAENILDRHLGKPVMRQQVALQGEIHVSIDLS
jgi:IS30 family transposase